MSLEMQSKYHTYADTYNNTSKESDNDQVLDSIFVVLLLLLLCLNVNLMTSILLERVVTAATSETEEMPCRNRARTMERRRPHQH